jgi:ribosome-binding factor A
MSHRIEQVNQFIQEELGNIFLSEIEFPFGSMATITKVVTASDMKSARVSVSVLPIKFAGSVLELLKRKIGHIQSLLNKKMSTKIRPKITFVIDRNQEEASTIESILNLIAKE